MTFTTLKVAGTDPIRLLHEHRSWYAATGLYPFLIGDDEELSRLEENSEFSDQDAATIIEASYKVQIADWIAERHRDIEAYGANLDEALGVWPGEDLDKASITLHRDILSGEIKPEVYLGLAKIAKPWQLPAVVKYGAWNDCPGADVHCAFHREWRERFGAEISGMSGDVIECTVKKPPNDKDSAIGLAWEQFYYCADIVDQGCGSVANLAATLLNSTYWYFWWD